MFQKSSSTVCGLNSIIISRKMLSEATTCSCLSGIKRMASNLFIVIHLLCLLQAVYPTPNYNSLHEQLSIRESLHKADRRSHANKHASTVIVEAGKVFRYSLNDFKFKNSGKEIAMVPIKVAGYEILPAWLAYHVKNNKLVGVPTKKDIGKLTIVLGTGIKGLNKTVKIELDVQEAKQNYYCNDGNPSLVAAAVLNDGLEHYTGFTRVQLLRQFSDFIDVEMHDLRLEERKTDSSFDQSMVTAGPGGSLMSRSKQQSGIVITWKVKCALGLAGDVSVNKLKHSSGKDWVFKAVGSPLVGWYVYKNQYRFRRQAFPAQTPVATPTASISLPKSVTLVSFGTPVISPTPSAVAKSTSSVIVITVMPVKPTPVIKTTKPPTTTQPLTMAPETTKKQTMPPTTTKSPETTTEKPVEKPTSEKTMKPTTEATMKPTTEATKKPTTEATKKPTMKTTMKPVKTTTMKPTTEPAQTTMKPKMTTMKPKMTSKPLPVVTVKPTQMRKHMKPINLFADQAYKIKINRDIFSRDIGGLKLALKKVELNKLISADEKWIYLDAAKHYLYVLPNLLHVGQNAFSIQSTDSSGKKEISMFSVIVSDENIVFNNYFNVTIDTDYTMFMGNAENKVNLIQKLAAATAVGYQTIRIKRFYEGSVIMNYACEALRSDDCNNVKAQAYKAKLARAEFKDSMAPDYIVLDATSERVPSNCGPGNPVKSPAAHTKDEYKWWEVVLIPVIVIAVLLLVIGLIFFFLYRRKRRYEPQKEDKNTFLYQKKPVIFREEYDEKPELLSLEPLILPNERAPLTNPAYQPRTSTPDGNASSSNSTEGDEKALNEKSTPPHTPQSPPRSPYGNSPPPYEA